jgi:hypothetical protein
VKFADRIENYLSLLTEQDPNPTAAPETPATDATTPDPTAQPQAAAGDQEPAKVAPEGYVDLVKLVVKAMQMNFPVGSLDDLWTAEITEKNAFTVEKAINAAMKEYGLYGGEGDDVPNDQRLENPNYRKFIQSINTTNLYQKLNKLKDIVNSRDQNPA